MLLPWCKKTSGYRYYLPRHEMGVALNILIAGTVHGICLSANFKLLQYCWNERSYTFQIWQMGRVWQGSQQGIRGTALDWFCSYLNNRLQYVGPYVLTKLILAINRYAVEFHKAQY